ncbi:hypothetical protein [Haladaptatus sp. DFWS20]|uniref:hypothetical protein n=1 Tax=Haladaptatus sp. DFWS20 TaxID=3403467 RepID=UPI003EB76725
MKTRELRDRISGWTLLLVGAGLTVFSVSTWGTDTPLLTAIFVLLLICGAFLISGRQKVYFYFLAVVGVLSLVQGFGFYLNRGVTALTAVFVLLGVLGVVYGVQAYRVL